MTSGELSVERAFGVLWNMDEDTFGFKIAAGKKSLACYELLLTLSSVYNLLGLAAPFILEGCIIIHIICKEHNAWDEPIPRKLKDDHLGGKAEESRKNQGSAMFSKIKYSQKCKDASVHHFSNASDTGYGQISYLRLVSYDNQIHCSLLTGKSRMTPKKYVSIPRLELTAVTP